MRHNDLTKAQNRIPAPGKQYETRGMPTSKPNKDELSKSLMERLKEAENEN
ncbi:hypothetical protein [Weissella viridescens]|uniref:hypothetical protein n=1 Tax=Weissella viridescens TaxID=1629 RepID=UPI003AF2698A